MQHDQGFTKRQWTPPSGDYSLRIASAAARATINTMKMQHVPTLLAVLMAIVMRRYYITRIFWWRRFVAFIKATKCRHWVSTCSDSIDWTCLPLFQGYFSSSNCWKILNPISVVRRGCVVALHLLARDGSALRLRCHCLGGFYEWTFFVLMGCFFSAGRQILFWIESSARGWRSVMMMCCVGINEKWYVLEKRGVMIVFTVKTVQTHSLWETTILCGSRSRVEEISEETWVDRKQERWDNRMKA